MFFSDHGEEIYDTRDYRGRDSNVSAAMLHGLHDVPFVVWHSQRYADLHPDIVARLRAGSHRPIMTGDICHLLFTLAGITTPYYRQERDPTSPHFRSARRIVRDNVDYDAALR